MERRKSEEERETEKEAKNEKVDRGRRKRNVVWRGIIG